MRFKHPITNTHAHLNEYTNTHKHAYSNANANEYTHSNIYANQYPNEYHIKPTTHYRHNNWY
jgi:hypothetical protein